MFDVSGKKLVVAFNLIDLIGIVIILSVAFFMQFVHHELPCPLCLLQRLGMFGMAFGIACNLKFGARPSHYAISCLSALFTAGVAVRQILLHIVPGSGSYGPAIFGFHLYTWSFIIAVVFLLVILFSLLMQDRFSNLAANLVVRVPKYAKIIINIVLLLIIILAAVNVVTTFMECGLNVCPENPVKYLVSMLKIT